MYTITREQVSSIHNAKCYLLYALDQAKNVLREDSMVMRNLITSLEHLEPVSSEIMGRVDMENDELYKMYETVGQEHNLRHTIWSLYNVKDMNSKSSIPVGDSITSYYTSLTEKVDGETWLDVWKAVNSLISRSQEEHGNHVFVEGFSYAGDGVYKVFLGS